MRPLLLVLLALFLAGCGTSYQRKFGDADVGYISEPLSGWGTTYTIALNNITLSRMGSQEFQVSGLPQSLFPSWFVIEPSKTTSMQRGTSLRGLGEDLEVQIKFVATDKTMIFQTNINASQLVTTADSPGTFSFKFIPENTRLPDVNAYDIHILVRKPLTHHHAIGDLRGLVVVCDPQYQKNY